MDDETPYRVVDLFSGAGGLSLGFERPELLKNLGDLEYSDLEHTGPGFETILAVEQNEDAAYTYLENFSDGDEEKFVKLSECDPIDPEVYTKINSDELTVVNGDITRLDFGKVDLDVDVIIGGPPCQGFSVMNQKTLDDLKNHDKYGEMNKLWKEFLGAVDELEPKMFLIENVPRFLNSAEAVDAFEQAQEEYNVTVDTLWAHHYEVPQKRERGFIMGSERGRPFFPDAISDDDSSGVERTVMDAIGDLEDDPSESDDPWHRGRRQTDKTKARMQVLPRYGENDKPRPPDRRDLIVDPDTVEFDDLSIEIENEDDLLPECWKGDHSGHTDHYGRLVADAPSVTIRKGFIQPMKGRHVHPYQPRSITPREGARLQTFPDKFEFAGSSKSSITDQIGNAVPPKLAYELASAMLTHLEADGEEAVLDEDELPEKTLELQARLEALRDEPDESENPEQTKLQSVSD